MSIADDPVRVRMPPMGRNSWPTSRLNSLPPATVAGRSAFEVQDKAKDLSSQTVTLLLINAGITVTFPLDPLESVCGEDLLRSNWILVKPYKLLRLSKDLGR